jgi:cytidine deaminase
MVTQEQVGQMVEAAKAAAQNSYSPYSKFRVGAAVLTEDGKIIEGCNVENASYGLANCAERTAVFKAVVDGAHKIIAVVVYTPTATATPPCGACRQVLNEFGPTAHVICVCDSDDKVTTTVDQLLPGAFGPGNLASANS